MRAHAHPAEPEPSPGRRGAGLSGRPSELVVVLFRLRAVGAARPGLAPVSGFATLVWPPTGIALAALLLRGVRLWPAVMLGAVVANVWTAPRSGWRRGSGSGTRSRRSSRWPCSTAWPGFRPGLDRLGRRRRPGRPGRRPEHHRERDPRGGGARWRRASSSPATSAETWRAWWVGDALGDLVVAPVLLTWRSLGGVNRSPRGLLEALALVVASVGLSCFVFLLGPALESQRHSGRPTSCSRC